MAELPWPKLPLEDFASVSTGQSAPQNASHFGGNNRFVRVSHLDRESGAIVGFDALTDEAVRDRGLRLHKAGTIVFPKSGASVRLEKRAQLPFDAYLVSHLAAVEGNPGIVDQSYLFYALRAHRFSAGKADGYPTIRLSEIRATPVPVPPLPEQRAIAHVLRTVQRAKEATEQVIAAARELKKSLMQRLFDGDWPVRRLGDVIEKPQYGYTETAQQEPIGPRFLRITDIQDGRVSWAAVPFCKCDANDLAKHALEPRDVVIARIGATTGKAFYVSEVPEPTVFASYLIRLRARFELNARYLGYFTQSDAYWRQINTEKGGRLKTGVNARTLNDLEIPLPPLAEQTALAGRLQAVDRKITGEEARHDALATLFDSLLHDLMSARLRVTDLEVPA